MREGILSVVSDITSLNSYELENIIKGKSEIDVKEWKKFTMYKDEYNEKHKVIDKLVHNIFLGNNGFI